MFGNKETRNNKIALSYLICRCKTVIENKSKHGINIYMPTENREVYERMLIDMNKNGRGHSLAYLDLYLPQTSRTLDEKCGITEDGDTQVRFVKDGRVMKSKIGKFMRNVIQESGIFSHLSESCINYFCESVTTEWVSNHPAAQKYELRVDNDFEEIYSSYHMASNFHSCMTDDDQWSFYCNAVEAKAASIWKDGNMYARCVIFTKVNNDTTGEVLRLAERQYSADKDPVLKRILINKLIEAGEIDGYKVIDASFDDADKFVLNNGRSIDDEKLSIDCWLNHGDTKSYQDSFKWFDYDEKTAYNYPCADECLGDCERTYGERTIEYKRWNGAYYVDAEASEEWVYENCVEIDDDFYDDWQVINDGRRIRCDEAIYSEYDDCYYHEGDVVFSNAVSSFLHEKDASYNDTMDDYLPINEEDELFEDWKIINWMYDEVNKDYVPQTMEVYVYDTEIRKWVLKRTCIDYRNQYTEINGENYKTEQITEYYYEVA
jgi:hypothetical protein